MSEEKRFKPGDIAKLVLTGEKVMILSDETNFTPDKSPAYYVRTEDLQKLDVSGIELEPAGTSNGSAANSEPHLCEALWLLGCARSILYKYDTPIADNLWGEINEFAVKAPR